MPARIESACQIATSVSTINTTTAAPMLCQVLRRAVPTVSARSSSNGFTRRTSSNGTSANSNDTSKPTATPCAAADAVMPTLVTPKLVNTRCGTAASATDASPSPSTHPPAASQVTCNTYVASTRPEVAPRHL